MPGFFEFRVGRGVRAFGTVWMGLAVGLAFVILLIVVSTSLLSAQTRGPKGARIFAVRQHSYWLPAGWDSSTVSAAETLLVAGLGEDSEPSQPVAIATLGAEESFRTQPVRFVGRIGALRVEPLRNERHSIFGYPEPSGLAELGSMAAEAGLWLRSRRHAMTPRWTDTVRLEVALDDDSVQVREVRAERRLGPRRLEGVRWDRIEAKVRMTVTTAVRVEQHLEPGGVRAAASLEGPVWERYLYERRTGRTDSLLSEGRLAGRIVYMHQSGRADTISGTWVFRRRGGWRPSAAAQMQAELLYFMRHGRYAEGPRPAPFRPIGEDSIGVEPDAESLAVARSRIPSPLDRIAVESVFLRSLFDSDSIPARIRGIDPVLARDAVMTRALVTEGRYHHRGPLSPAWALTVAGLLADEHLQRELALDREDLLSSVLDMIERPKRVDAAAAPALLDGARRARDPLGRDLQLLAAYMADPRAALPALRAHADSAEGFGPVALRYAAGDAEVLLNSWGLRRGESAGADDHQFPGLSTDVGAHGAYQRSWTGVSYGNGEVPAVDQWFSARGLDARAEFRRRFRSGGRDEDRLVWARYLMAMGDREPVAWLRDTIAAGHGPLRGPALTELSAVPEPVTDPAIVAELQDLALDHVMCGDRLLDTLQKPIERFWVHDERPGEWFLVTDHLAPEVVARWSGQLRPISADSLGALARGEGLQMGLVVSVPTRVADQYHVEVSLRPFARRGEVCLCGGGSDLTLEKRGGQWVVVGHAGWIS